MQSPKRSPHNDTPNQTTIEPTAGRGMNRFDFMKQFSMVATLAPASDGSALSR